MSKTVNRILILVCALFDVEVFCSFADASRVTAKIRASDEVVRH